MASLADCCGKLAYEFSRWQRCRRSVAPPYLKLRKDNPDDDAASAEAMTAKSLNVSSIIHLD